MEKQPESRLPHIFIILLIIAYFIVLFSGTKILISEEKVNPGETYIVEDYGNLGDSEQSQLVCKYFNGRGILTSVYWYSPNNILGRDSCPFVKMRDE